MVAESLKPSMSALCVVLAVEVITVSQDHTLRFLSFRVHSIREVE